MRKERRREEGGREREGGRRKRLPLSLLSISLPPFFLILSSPLLQLALSPSVHSLSLYSMGTSIHTYQFRERDKEEKGVSRREIREGERGREGERREKQGAIWFPSPSLFLSPAVLLVSSPSTTLISAPPLPTLCLSLGTSWAHLLVCTNLMKLVSPS